MTKKKAAALIRRDYSTVDDHDDIGRFALVKGGHEHGRVCLTVGVTENGDYLIADGRRRKLERPKLKGARHVQLLEKSEQYKELVCSQKLTNRQIRRILFHRRDYSAKG